MKGKLGKGSTRGLSNSLKVSLGHCRRAASQAQVSSSPCPAPPGPWSKAWAIQDSCPCVQVTSKGFQGMGITLPRPNHVSCGAQGRKNTKLNKNAAFWAETVTSEHSLSAPWEKQSCFCWSGDSSALSLHLSTADKGICFHILGEYQYLSFRRKRTVNDNSLPDACMMNLRPKSPWRRRIGLKWVINIRALQLYRMFQYLNE